MKANTVATTLNMKAVLTTMCLAICLTSTALKAQVYKCKDNNNKIVYSSTKCKADTQISIKNKIKSSSTDTEQSKGSPVGYWFNEDKPLMTANLASGGSFRMTDHTGTAIQGTWQRNKSGAYSLDASFQGFDMFLKMKYDIKSDTLRLSKPGFVNTLQEYQRK
jgi:hypothetical protein